MIARGWGGGGRSTETDGKFVHGLFQPCAPAYTGLMLRLDDPSDNHGKGWRQMSEAEIAEHLYFTVLMLPKQLVRDLKDRNAAKSSEAAKRVSVELAKRLSPCAVFRAARSYEWRGFGREAGPPT